MDRPILAQEAAAPMPAPPSIVPPGWIGLERCNLSPALGQVLEVPHVLLHPEVGVALIDIAPGQTKEAEAAFRARLETARFAAIFPGYLPVIHLQVPPSALDQLAPLLTAAFADLPPVSLPGGDGWVSVVRRALAPRMSGRAAPSPAAPTPDRRAPPIMLNREVAAQRAGLAPSPETEVPPLPDEARSRLRPVPVVVGLAALAATLAAAAMFWSGPRSTEPPVTVAAMPERSGDAQPTAAPLAGGGAPSPAPLVPRNPAPGLGSTAAPAPLRAPDASPPPVAATPAPPRDRVATSPRLPEAAPPAPPPPQERAAPPPPTPAVAILPPPAPPPAADRVPRVMVRAAANLRAAPENRAPVLRIAPQGEVLREFSRSRDGWVEVGDTRPQGWIFSKLLVPAKP
ncbi:SH3 domain-containing protein [Roseicella aerolata]|uniref:SH3 domain-containing protein n=1 Tax=Roseicella aerolata TaxID=2883479 RepID=A0A9X1I9W2_9PROT|nr:SH3 domain-containing protein [Roseicella aerolata]MCB4820909.1 SH3 domain-containing protein [Roseicella aerolata]